MANDSDLHNAPTPSMPAESEKRTFVVQTPIYSYVMQYKLGHILKAQYDHGGWQRSLPLQFNSTQVALADALGIQMSRSEESMTVASVERDFIESLALGPGARPQALRTLGAALHLFHLKYLCKEMDDAGTDTARRAEILVNMAEPLQRYLDTYPLLGDLEENGFPDLSIQVYIKWIVAKVSKRFEAKDRPVFRDESYQQQENTLIDVFARQGTALLGGLTLVVPLIMMTFLTTVKARLAIVCCFVFFFAMTVGLITNVSGQDALAATAAYTAVLVVFVGTSSTP